METNGRWPGLQHGTSRVHASNVPKQKEFGKEVNRMSPHLEEREQNSRGRASVCPPTCWYQMCELTGVMFYEKVPREIQVSLYQLILIR